MQTCTRAVATPTTTPAGKETEEDGKFGESMDFVEVGKCGNLMMEWELIGEEVGENERKYGGKRLWGLCEEVGN